MAFFRSIATTMARLLLILSIKEVRANPTTID